MVLFVDYVGRDCSLAANAVPVISSFRRGCTCDARRFKCGKVSVRASDFYKSDRLTCRIQSAYWVSLRSMLHDVLRTLPVAYYVWHTYVLADFKMSKLSDDLVASLISLWQSEQFISHINSIVIKAHHQAKCHPSLVCFTWCRLRSKPTCSCILPPPRSLCFHFVCLLVSRITHKQLNRIFTVRWKGDTWTTTTDEPIRFRQ